MERVNYRYISFDTRINMLQKSVDNRDSFHKPLLLIFLVIFYLVVFDSYVTLILIPSEFLDSTVLTKNVLKIARKCLELTYCLTTSYYNFVILIYSLPFNFLNYASSYTYEIIALWYLFLQLKLSCDIHPNPGPGYHATNFSGGFLSFCNWNLNTLSKEDFYRVSLLEAHNFNFNYDIISLCETSLNDTVQVPDKYSPWV